MGVVFWGRGCGLLFVLWGIGGRELGFCCRLILKWFEGVLMVGYGGFVVVFSFRLVVFWIVLFYFIVVWD